MLVAPIKSAQYLFCLTNSMPKICERKINVLHTSFDQIVSQKLFPILWHKFAGIAGTLNLTVKLAVIGGSWNPTSLLRRRAPQTRENVTRAPCLPHSESVLWKITARAVEEKGALCLHQAKHIWSQIHTSENLSIRAKCETSVHPLSR